MVEDVETLRVELQIEALRQFEGLGQGHVCIPGAGSDERVPAEIGNATQAGRREDGQPYLTWDSSVSGTVAVLNRSPGTPALREGTTARGEVRDRGVGPIIAAVIEVVIATQILAVATIHIRCGAGSSGI